LVAGSGAGQRNESLTYSAFNFFVSPPKYPACGSSSVNVNIFVDIANYFSSQGFAVLRYDKRTCIAGNGVPGCSYPVCPLNDPSPPSNCLDLNTFTAWDLVLDASEAVQFLASLDKVDGQNITVMGHSEGVTIVPYVANNNTNSVKQMVLLSGVGVPMTDVVLDQLAKSIEYATTILDSCTVMGAPSSTLTALEQELNQAIQVLELVTQSTQAILNGTYPPTELVFWLSPNVPVGYVQSLYAMGQWTEIYTVINRFVSNGGNVMAINSPTDYQVYPKVYNPLHAALQSITNNPQNVFILNDLTHCLTPSDFSSGSVSQSVFETIMNWANSNTTTSR
jgi:dienelactone hydrolase